MKKRWSLSVVLATYNEAGNLARCLDSVKSMANEVIIVDGESTDETVKIGMTYGAKVITTTNKPIFHINKQMAIEAAVGDWILQLDADEVVDEALASSIKAVLSGEVEHSAYWIKRRNYFLGRFLTKGGQYPDPVIRLFKKGLARLPQVSVHEQMEVTGTTGWLEGHLLHYNAPTFGRYLINANRYTDLTAQEMYSKNIPLNLKNDFHYFLVKPMSIFIALYLRHRGMVDGFPGLVFALFSGLHYPLAYFKLKGLYDRRHR
jgi:glycosyltransferase involved in cell wall biosynthesis